MNGRLLAGLVLAAGLTACNRDDSSLVRNTGGNPLAGKAAIRKYGCETCHAVPGIGEPRGQAGPSLDGMANRAFLAGQFENTVPNAMKWIRYPQSMKPGTLMPDTGVTEGDARDIVAYLYSQR